ncbi:MAG: MBL fold metallo-hydrolase [Thermoanaerobaculales bacterium]|nr:MBL fold metallo-hydrolase [Thermoanaerobaculales bacterium]
MRITCLVENSCPEAGAGLRPEFGLSLHLEVGGARVLFDTGASGLFLANAERLGIDIAAVDALVISHQHFDHGGGLAAFLEANPHAPVYLRSAPLADRSFRAFGLIRRSIGIDRELLERQHSRFELVAGRREVAPGVFLLCDIGSTHPRPRGNRRLFVERGGRVERDPFDHELMMVARADDGMVVISGCSHHGVLNMLEAAGEAFPGVPIKALIGGFHLIGLPFYDSMAASRREVEAIGRRILEQVAGPVFTGHCTGGKGYRALAGVMGEALQPLATGTVIEA